MDDKPKISIQKTKYAIGNQDKCDYISSAMFCTPIPLDFIVGEKIILQKLADLGVKDTSQLWIPVALDYILDKSIGVSTLKQMAYFLSSQCSPFKPEYRVDNNYSISVEAELSTDSLDSVNSGLGEVTFSAEVELPTGIIRSNAGWRRQSIVGKSMKYVDMEYEDPITQELYQVQVKSTAGLSELCKYSEKFSSSGFKRLYFVVHSPKKDLAGYRSEYENVELVMPERLARMIVDQGLVDWLLKKIR